MKVADIWFFHFFKPENFKFGWIIRLIDKMTNPVKWKDVFHFAKIEVRGMVFCRLINDF